MLYHSYPKPKIKINKNKYIIIYICIIFIFTIIIIIGIIITNSTSKIKKITAIIKKCLENGIRDDSNGLNPHSNGDIFSRSIIDLYEIKYKIIVNIIKIKIRKTE